MSLSRLCRAAAAVLTAALLLSVALPASADTASDEARVLTLIQQTRASVGAPALRVDSALTSAARSWAAKMARDGTISHNVGLGSQVTASKLAENVGMGATVDIVHQGFLNSPGHRANMVDTGVNSVGVGVAYSGGYVFVVQDYAQLATTTTRPPPPPNRAPTTPTQLTPANAASLSSAPAQATARYADPDGNPGAVFFLVADDLGRVLRQAWSGVVCSGCVAAASIAGLPDGMYALYTASVDGLLPSPMSAPSVFAVDHTAPAAPIGLQRAGGHALVFYTDADGSAGWVYVFLYGPGGTLLTHGWTPKVCSGCATAYALPPLGPGTYSLYAFSYDGLVSPSVGPVTFVV
jgi:hypothetical protein